MSLALGILLLLLGIAMPMIIPMEATAALSNLLFGLRNLDSGYVLVAAAWLVCVNTVRALPIFVGGFVAAEAAGEVVNRRNLPTELAYVVPVTLIPLAYATINAAYGLDYHFGTPAILAIAGMLVMHRLSWHTQGIFNKLIIFSLFLFGLQWLHVIPVLSGYGFGAGSISRDIKMGAVVLGVEPLLTNIAVLSSVFTIGLAFLMAKFMVDHSRHLNVVELQQRQEMELLGRRLEIAEARIAQEVQNLVHDLRAPLSSVQSLLTTLATGLQDDMRRNLQRAGDAIGNMLDMISEMLDADSRRVVPAEQLLDHVKLQFPHTGERLVFRARGDDLPAVRINVMRVTRAVANFVQNALEASIGQEQPVVVKVGTANGWLRIRIRDHGPGIPDGTEERLSVPGFTTKSSSGLGIPFATGVIAGGHAGRVRFVSGPGHGTLVIIELPVADLAIRERDRADTDDFNGTLDGEIFGGAPGRILVIDDDRTILTTLQLLAEDAGWAVTTHQSPALGLEEWRQQMFDLAIIDYRMPDMDGLTLLRRMRRHDTKTPIVVLTVDDDSNLAKRFLFEGANDFILKPIKPVDFLSRLRLHMRDGDSVAPTPPSLEDLTNRKGVQLHTLELIAGSLHRAREPLSAKNIAEQCNIARPTAYRYLALLEEHGYVQTTMQYGRTGRPVKLYHWK